MRRKHHLQSSYPKYAEPLSSEYLLLIRSECCNAIFFTHQAQSRQHFQLINLGEVKNLSGCHCQ